MASGLALACYPYALAFVHARRDLDGNDPLPGLSAGTAAGVAGVFYYGSLPLALRTGGYHLKKAAPPGHLPGTAAGGAP